MISKTQKREFLSGRTGDIKPIILQPRDEEIITMVYEFRILSRKQLQRLFNFPCVTRINIRLKKLYNHGYLARKYCPFLWGTPNLFYYLGPKGIEILSGKLGRDSGILKKEREILQDQKDLFLNHQFFLNEMRIALSLAVKQNPEIRLVQWSKDGNCLIDFISKKGKRTVFRPDGYFCLSTQVKPHPFFLEVDCSTMSAFQIKSKVRTYLEYALSGQFENDFGLKNFRVLIVTKSQDRLLNLKTAIEEQINKIFYLTFRDLLDGNPIQDQIWFRAGRQGLFPLLEG